MLSSRTLSRPLAHALARSRLLIALVSGALTVFAYAPFGLWPLQLLTLAILFLLALHASSVRDAMYLGWAFACTSIASGTHWLYVSMHDYGGLPAVLAVVAVLLLAAALALLYGLALGGAYWLSARLTQPARPAITALMILPACWMLADWSRGWIFTGFSWIATGYAHTDSPLSGYAAIIGVYGVGWLAALLAACIALMLAQRRLHKFAVALFVSLPIAGMALQSVHWTQPMGQTISVRLLQGNVPQEMKFDAATLADSLEMYRQMITAAPADLIATPETALPMLASQLPSGYLEQFAHYAKAHNSTIMLGLPWTGSPGIYLNSVIGMPAGEVNNIYRYDKHHLVPFGEFIPPGARWFIDLMHIPLGDFGRGDVLQAPMPVKDQWVLPNICYEDLFGEEIATQLQAAHMHGGAMASILLNVSNIAWFGDTIALPQHLQISRMRTLETGRPMLRATNTGATAVIDAAGKVTASLPAYTRATLAAEVQGMQGRTPYLIMGNSLPATVALLLLLLCAWMGRRQTRLPE